MRVLISTQTGDVHAAAVALSLRDMGHDVDILHGSDFPEKMRVSYRARLGCRPRIDVFDAEKRLELEDVDVIWNRRHYLYKVPPGIHPADEPFVERECRHFMSGIWHLIGSRNAFWVNPETHALSARSKPMQIEAAIEAGMVIPDTLMSNDPAEIRAFIEDCRSGAIYKPFMQAGWKTQNGFSALFTADVGLEDLPSDGVLRNAPGIFQSKMEKAHEVRATFMGATCLAVKIKSQQTEIGTLDWRRTQGKSMPLESTTLPDEIYGKCRTLMRRLGIVFGCFDFIVTPDNEYVFLEVNEMGQFLWVEQILSEVPMLDAFSRFLVSRDSDFRYQPSADSVKFSNYSENRVCRLMSEEREHHVRPSLWHVANEV